MRCTGFLLGFWVLVRQSLNSPGSLLFELPSSTLYSGFLLSTLSLCSLYALHSGFGPVDDRA